jgi:preprotein translocase subunit SecE
MARNTRQQRRARRRQEQGAAAAPEQQQKVSQRARARQQQVRPSSQPQQQQTGRRGPAPRGRFIRESAAELRKVEWPGRAQVTTGTIVVIIACAITGAYLWLLDLGLRNLVEEVILRGT